MPPWSGSPLKREFFLPQLFLKRVTSFPLGPFKGLLSVNYEIYFNIPRILSNISEIHSVILEIHSIILRIHFFFPEIRFKILEIPEISKEWKNSKN